MDILNSPYSRAKPVTPAARAYQSMYRVKLAGLTDDELADLEMAIHLYDAEGFLPETLRDLLDEVSDPCQQVAA